MGVGPNGTDLRLKLLSASNNVAGPLVFYNVDKGRIFHQSGDLYDGMVSVLDSCVVLK